MAQRWGTWLAPVLVVGAAAAALVAWPASAQPAKRQKAPTAEQVRSTYLRDCAVCHGAEGEGSDRGPHIVGVGRASVDYQLTTGRMPLADPTERTERHRPRYEPAMIVALVDYIAAFGPGGPDIPNVDVSDADLSAGGTLYRLECAACHAWSGDGGALLEREAPSIKRATPVQVGEAVRVGPGSMPAFGADAISDRELANVAAYIRYLHAPDDRGGLSLYHLGPLVEGGVALLVALGLLILATVWIGDRE